MFGYKRTVEKAIEGLGFNPKDVKAGDDRWVFLNGSAIIVITIVANEGLFVFSPLVKLPKSNLIGLYRYALEQNFVDTGQARYFLHENVIHIGMLRPLESIDKAEIQAIVADVAANADKADDYMASEFGAPRVSDDKRLREKYV